MPPWPTWMEMHSRMVAKKGWSGGWFWLSVLTTEDNQRQGLSLEEIACDGGMDGVGRGSWG